MSTDYSTRRQLTLPHSVFALDTLVTDLWAVSISEAAALASMKCHAATQGDIDYRTNFTYLLQAGSPTHYQ